ncbi:MAG: two-component regulator propeller domain-containing protein, partial [Bacteroidota bacterium]
MSQSLQIINHFSIESGLPSNYVYDVIQDHQGYLWIMTNAGLCKHNGSELEFIQIPNHLFDLKGAIELFEYNKDQLWIIRYTDILPNGEPQNSNSDLIIYDKKLKQFSKIEDNSISIPFCVNTISHITPFENSFLITTIDGKLYEMKDKQFKLLFQKEGEKFSYATKIADDQYWLRTPSELFQLIDDELQLKNQVNSSYFSAITSSKD